MTIPNPNQAACLQEAKRQQVVRSWPIHIPDEIIRSCRRAGWLRTWEVPGIQMAQTVFYGGSPIRDQLTELGEEVLRQLQQRYGKVKP